MLHLLLLTFIPYMSMISLLVLYLFCVLFQCIRLHGRPEGAMMMDKFTQFLSEKFLYDQTLAIDMLIQAGLKEQLFDLAKVGVAWRSALW